MIIVPLSTGQRLASTTEYWDNICEGRNENMINFILSRIERTMYSIVGDADSYSVSSQKDLMETASAVNKTMTLLLGGSAAISLIVGGIGIMNIMLVSVSERTKEIGIRKAIGAKRGNILLQFLIESIVLSSFGGIIGVGIGIISAQIFTLQQERQLPIPHQSCYYHLHFLYWLEFYSVYFQRIKHLSLIRFKLFGMNRKESDSFLRTLCFVSM